MTETQYNDFFEKQKDGTAITKDIPIVKKMNNNEELSDDDLIGYLLMLSMGIIK